MGSNAKLRGEVLTFPRSKADTINITKQRRLSKEYYDDYVR